MKFGVREVCNVAFKCKADNTKIGDRVFKKDELVIYFDTAKTSSMEGSTTAVYAQGGRGNPRLITWEGEKTMTFSFEEALLSPLGLSILLSANLTSTEDYFHHVVIKTRAYKDTDDADAIKLTVADEVAEIGGDGAKLINPAQPASDAEKAATVFVYKMDETGSEMESLVDAVTFDESAAAGNVLEAVGLVEGAYYTVDGYIKVGGTTLTITPDKFSDYFYIEAETLFRRESDGVDKAAQIVIPKGKVTSNFTITMANSGDPSTFTFSVEAMPDYVKFDKTKKVLCAINVIE